MSSSSKPRVVRKHSPKKLFKPHQCRALFPLLMEDFDQRCAYSMVHVGDIGSSQMEIDHHNPNKKKKSPYTNLFTAHGVCNGAKGEEWPMKELRDMGIRFLNPCDEGDYNEQIFENPSTHELVGTTPAAIYHIDKLDLNNPTFVEHRRQRTFFSKVVNTPLVCNPRPGEEGDAAEIVGGFVDILKRKIPYIKPPPKRA